MCSQTLCFTFSCKEYKTALDDLSKASTGGGDENPVVRYVGSRLSFSYQLGLKLHLTFSLLFIVQNLLFVSIIALNVCFDHSRQLF